MKSSCKIALLIVVACMSLFVSIAQTTSFRARLSEVPVTPQTYRTITGVGEVFATLNGNTLTVDGTFEGLSSAASAAHVHNAPKAMNGPPIGALDVVSSPAGQVTGSLELTDEQRQALLNEELYIVVHSQNNPGGEVRGWLLPREN